MGTCPHTLDEQGKVPKGVRCVACVFADRDRLRGLLVEAWGFVALCCAKDDAHADDAARLLARIDAALGGGGEGCDPTETNPTDYLNDR